MVPKTLWLTFAASLGLGLALSAPGGSTAVQHTQHLTETLTNSVTADVDDFEFRSFDAEYVLGRDAGGHSTLRTTETLVAEFPQHDQNRGIRRAIPERYQGHPTELRIIAVTDERGNARQFEEDSDDDIRFLTIAGDDYVHGQQSYVIEYEQRNVTEHFADTGRDEFYWDVNGLDWAQPFARVTATVHLEDGVSDGLTPHMSAVQGGKNATNPAKITAAPDGNSVAIESSSPLAPHQTLTFAIGFEPGTFSERDSGFFASPAPMVSALGALASLVGVVWAFVVRRRYLRDAPGRGIIVPEYEPLPGVSILTSANILANAAGREVPAQLVDLAVRGHVRLLERGAIERASNGAKISPQKVNGKVKGSGKGKGFFIELIDATTITDEHEYKLVQALFGYEPQPGAIRDLKKSASATTTAFEKLQKRVAADALYQKLRMPYPTKQVTWLMVVASIAVLVGIIFGAVALDNDFGGALPIVTLFGAIVGLIVTIILVSRRPLAARGVEIRDHLRGLKMYINLAEADRLRYLQSPEGAERRNVSRHPGADPIEEPPSPTRMVHLYERLLPYAMLFGQEKKWAAELGRLYEHSGEDPSWYLGVSTFNAASFSSSFSSMSSGMTAAYSSAASGGSGGASAGGGGGGGGGGGV